MHELFCGTAASDGSTVHSVNERSLSVKYLMGVKLITERRNAEAKICLFTALSTTYCTWTFLAANPALQSKQMATDRLRYDSVTECVNILFQHLLPNAPVESVLFKIPQRI
jgi:hypothetical protein